MLPTQERSFRLAQVAGIDVFVHWSWFLVAVLEIQNRSQRYHSIVWNVAEYLALFCIVLLHEFGHALACRQVGGVANRIVLWPLGGVAYVSPPPRPGAVLWSIAAGPLVNVALLPVLSGLSWLAFSAGWKTQMPDAYHFLRDLATINIVLLVFNMLPVFPLDGGQILQSLLWFVIGRVNSLRVVTVIGFLAGLGLIAFALAAQSVWLGIMAVFILIRCVSGFKIARSLSQILAMPRRPGLACPSCGASPRIGEFWLCPQCHKPLDTFEHNAACPDCAGVFPQTACPDCHVQSPMVNWAVVPGTR